VTRDCVGAAGGKIFDSRGLIHQGVLLSDAQGNLRDAGKGSLASASGPTNLLWLTQNVSALGSDGFAISRARYVLSGGFSRGLPKDEAIRDICGRLARQYRLVWSPFAEFMTQLSRSELNGLDHGEASAARGDYNHYRPYWCAKASSRD
jgi:hypothetical protein